jgi:hypothetical protein
VIEEVSFLSKKENLMKRLYLDPVTLVSMTALADAGRPATTPVGYCFDEHNRPMRLFVATDKESGKTVRDKNGKPAFNFRPSK